MREETVRDVQELVNKMKEHTILEYEPQAVVIDIVENFFMKTFTKEQLLEYPMNILRGSIRRMYVQTFPESIDNPELLENFADDVVFYIGARLSNQEILNRGK